MDSLDQIADTAGPLLRRVDELLTVAGAPADHRVWAELRRVRLLPGDAVQAVTALRSAELADAVPELRADARAYAAIAESLPAPAGWTGDAADAYDASRRRAADHLSGSPSSLDERLEATADLGDALAEWMTQARSDLAVVLAQVLASTEALEVSIGGAGEVLAAAEVAERILGTVADSYELATDLLHGSAELATPLRA
jgi:hypothetical protein